MATKAKYTRVRAEDPKDDKPDTDIIIKNSDTYGIFLILFRSLYHQSTQTILWIKQNFCYY